jgi:hypothetical protein
MIQHMLGDKVESPSTGKDKDSKHNSEKSKPSPTKSKLDLNKHFSEPPAPPPQAPLPEKPDVARALADPVIRPLLRRDDTALPMSNSSSPTRVDHSGDILRLCEELKLAKGELSNQSQRMKSLETELEQERAARTSAEARLERGDVSAASEANRDPDHPISPTSASPPDLQTQLDRLRTSMDEMKQTMELFRQRAVKAESERDEARQSLAEMVERKRRENAEAGTSPSRPRKSPAKRTPVTSPSASSFPAMADGATNGHAIRPGDEVEEVVRTSPTSEKLLERAGVEEGRPITLEQARIMTELLTKEVLGEDGVIELSGGSAGEGKLTYYGRPYGSAAMVVIVGVLVMGWINGWPKVER